MNDIHGRSNRWTQFFAVFDRIRNDGRARTGAQMKHTLAQELGVPDAGPSAPVIASAFSAPYATAADIERRLNTADKPSTVEALGSLAQAHWAGERKKRPQPTAKQRPESMRTHVALTSPDSSPAARSGFAALKGILNREG